MPAPSRPVKVGDVKKNVEDICRMLAEADEKRADILVFPELALTGYSCAALFFQETLLSASRKGLAEIADCTAEHPRITTVVGSMYGCAGLSRWKEPLVC